MTNPKLTIELNPGEYFREQISAAAANQQFPLSADTEFYLVNLLCDFISPAKLATTSAGEIDVLDTPLAFLFKAALEAPPTEQCKIYKTLGDTSLYISGFFQDFCLRKTIDMSYFKSLGSHAYSNVSSLINNSQSAPKKQTLYDELASKFSHLVEVIAEVADQSGVNQASSLVSLYERWSRHPSERLRKLLVEQGVIPLASHDKSVQ